MIIVGVDPGLTGAIAFLGPGLVRVVDMPTVDLPGAGLVSRRVDARGLADIVRHGVPAGESCLVVVEQVRTMGGKNNAVQTQGSLMRTLGAIEAVFDMMRIKPIMVEPQTWKGFYALGTVKADSLIRARELYPSAGPHLRLARHHNRAESLLIAHWGNRTLL